MVIQSTHLIATSDQFEGVGFVVTPGKTGL